MEENGFRIVVPSDKAKEASEIWNKAMERKFETTEYSSPNRRENKPGIGGETFQIELNEFSLLGLLSEPVQLQFTNSIPELNIKEGDLRWCARKFDWTMHVFTDAEYERYKKVTAKPPPISKEQTQSFADRATAHLREQPYPKLMKQIAEGQQWWENKKKEIIEQYDLPKNTVITYE